MQLQDQVAIITGASSGIGAETASQLAAEGARVVLTARREERLTELKSEVEDAGGTALVVTADVTDRDAVKAVAKAARDAFGRIDILVNNAGIMPLTYARNMRTDDWYSVVDVNINGVLHALEAVLPTMIEQERGHIVNISSTAGRKVYPGGAFYSLTKFGVRALSEGLRAELGPKYGIRTTCIEPGAVATELFESVKDEDVINDISDMFGDLETLEAEDIAAAILHAVTAPDRASVFEVLVMPTGQAY